MKTLLLSAASTAAAVTVCAGGFISGAGRLLQHAGARMQRFGCEVIDNCEAKAANARASDLEREKRRHEKACQRLAEAQAAENARHAQATGNDKLVLPGADQS